MSVEALPCLLLLFTFSFRFLHAQDEQIFLSNTGATSGVQSLNYSNPDTMIKTATYDGLPADIKYTYLYPNGQSSLVIASANQSMLRLDRFVSTLKELWNINDTSFIKINAALNELVSNAIVHGNHSHPDKNVYVQAVRSGNQFAFMVRDQGSGFDHRHLPDPFDTADTDDCNGRGIFIARNLADEMHYGPKGNCVWALFKQGL